MELLSGCIIGSFFISSELRRRDCRGANGFKIAGYVPPTVVTCQYHQGAGDKVSVPDIRLKSYQKNKLATLQNRFNITSKNVQNPNSGRPRTFLGWRHLRIGVRISREYERHEFLEAQAGRLSA